MALLTQNLYWASVARGQGSNPEKTQRLFMMGTKYPIEVYLEIACFSRVHN